MRKESFPGLERPLSRIGLGAMPLSIAGRPGRDDAKRVIRRSLSVGVTLIDTANAYCIDEADEGHNERLIAEALAEIPGASERVVIATKGGLTRPRGAWVTDARPSALRGACERSLKALGRETIELYQLHAPDNRVPFADSVGELVKLQREGKIEHIGLSNVDVEQIKIALELTPIASVQNRCNIFERGALTQGIVQFCVKNGIAFLPHSPVGGHRGHERLEEEPTLARIAARRGVSVYQVALAWLLDLHPLVFPIPGASKVSSIESSVKACELVLDEIDRRELKQAFRFGPLAT